MNVVTVSQKLKYSSLIPLGLILVTIFGACAGKPGPVLQWSKTFDGGNIGEGYSLQQTTDGGYTICGTNSGNVWLIKTDANGNKLWDKTFDDGGNSKGEAVHQTTDGGYIVCGHTWPDTESEPWDIWLIKTDTNGNKLWDRKFSGDNTLDRSHSVQQTTDGGYIVCGETIPYLSGDSDIWLIKTNADGNKLWDKKFSGLGDSIGNAVQLTMDGGYIVAGETRVSSDFNGSVWLIKTDADGNKLWDRIFDGEENDIPEFYYYVRAVQQITDGGYIVGGTEDKQSTEAGSYNAWLMKTDADGNKLWNKKWGGNRDSYGHGVQQTVDGGYVICGTTTQTSEPSRKSAIWLIKTDAEGNILWDETFIGNGQANGNSVQQTADGGYIICGDTRSHQTDDHSILLLKIAPEK